MKTIAKLGAVLCLGGALGHGATCESSQASGRVLQRQRQGGPHRIDVCPNRVDHQFRV
jgi:hypothetical protein